MTTPLTGLLVVGVIAVFVGGLVIYNTYIAPPKDPLMLYKELGEKEEKLDNARLKYTMHHYQLDALPGAKGVEVDVAKYGDATKTVFSIQTLNYSVTWAIYTKNNVSVTCTEGGYLGSGLNCRLSLSIEDIIGSIQPTFAERILKNATVTESVVLNRPCYNYNFRLDKKDFEDIYGEPSTATSTSGAIEGQLGETDFIEYDMCLDKQYGFNSFVAASIIRMSRFTGKEEETAVFNMTLTSFAQDVKPEEVVIPVPFDVQNADCTEESVDLDIVPFTDRSELELSVNVSSSYEEGTVTTAEVTGLEFGKTKRVTVPASLAAGSYRVEACAEGYCDSSSCYMVEGIYIASVSCNTVSVVNSGDTTIYTDDIRVYENDTLRSVAWDKTFISPDQYTSGTLAGWTINKGDVVRVETEGGASDSSRAAVEYYCSS